MTQPLKFIDLSKVISGNYTPQEGDTYCDSNGRMLTWNHNKWYIVGYDIAKNTKQKRIIDELNTDSLDSIIEGMLVVLMKKGIVKDMHEFKEEMQTNKLAVNLSEV